MSDVPAVSVVIPLYNKGSYIARALNSVFAQTFQDFEVIVVDDGSTDEGAAVAQGFYDPRIQVIQQENQGVSATRNRGIEAARAELVAFLDADDEWLPGFLETVVRLRKKFPEAGAYGTAISTKRGGSIRYPRYRSVPSPNWEGMIADYFRSQILGDFVMYSSSVAIPKEILQEMNGFVVGVRWGEDLDLWGRIALKYRIGFSTSRCSIIHETSEDLDRIYNRVSITKENPFIKSADTAVARGEYSYSSSKNYLILYLDKITIESAIYNTILGRMAESEEILRSCRTKNFFLTKTFLRVWHVMSMNVNTKRSRTRDRYISLATSHLQSLDLHILTFVLKCCGA